jgi:hypothetical protein
MITPVSFAMAWLNGNVPFCDPVDLALAELLAQRLIGRGATKGFALADMAFRDKADVLRCVIDAMLIDPSKCGTTMPDARMPFFPV